MEVFVEGGVEGMPGEGGALDAHGVVPYSREGHKILLVLRGNVAERRGFFGCEELVKGFIKRIHLRNRKPFDQSGHDGGRGFTNSAALTLKSDIGNNFILYPQRKVYLIAAEGVIALGVMGRVGKAAIVAGVTAIFQDDFLVEALQFRAHD